MRDYQKDYVSLAKELRRNMTPEEKRLWYDFLRPLPVHVYRQKNIGNYIADFYIASGKIVIELDGSQHGEEENVVADQKRDEELQKLGCTVLRYPNREINENFDAVCRNILEHLNLGV